MQNCGSALGTSSAWHPRRNARAFPAAGVARRRAAELGALFTDDAEWVNIVGMWWRGRADVQRAHQAFHEVMFRDVPLHFTGVSVRAIAPGVATAIGTIRMGDFTTPGGHVMRDTRDRLTLVLVQRGAAWKIASGHNTVIDPAAAAHDPVNRP